MKKTNKKVRISAALTALAMVFTLTSCTPKESVSPDNQTTTQISESGDDFVAFHPADIGVAPMPVFEYPCMGLTAKLTDTMLSKMESQDVVMLTAEEYDSADTFSYAIMRWYSLTEEQKNEEVTAFDPEAWSKTLAKVGTLGAYKLEMTEKLDELTGCTQHTELGKSPDGTYVYYLSLSDEAGDELKNELQNTQVTLTDVHKMDLQNGNGVFSEVRSDNTDVGNFTTTDINGGEFNQEYFKNHELTLVNIFTTWCSFCIEEMPELEKLSREMADKGVGVVGVVHDATDRNGNPITETVNLAKVLQQRAGVTFPLVLPDETAMNGMLKGINSYPTTFFVDKNGNIVGEPIMGAKNFDDWKNVVEQMLANLGEAQ